MEDAIFSKLIELREKEEARLENRLNVFEGKLDKVITANAEMGRQIAALQVRTGLTGLIGGAIPAGIVLLIIFFKGGL